MIHLGNGRNGMDGTVVVFDHSIYYTLQILVTLTLSHTDPVEASFIIILLGPLAITSIK